MPLSHDDPRVRILKTAFVIHYHVDLSKAREFYLDFGMSIAAEQARKEIFFKGYGTEPFVYIARQAEDGKNKFGGAAYAVERRAELDRAIATIPGASSVSKLDAPGGGEIVSFSDPVGHKVHLVYGQTGKDAEPPHLEKLVVNYEDEKPRKGRFQRFEMGLARVHRWGHYGVTYPLGSYQTMFDYIQGWNSCDMFFHIDRGTEFTDHHAFFFKQAKSDEELKQLGHDYLSSKGYQLCWGIGRHVLGSQVFDYWFDPNNFIVEHYADGDVANCDTPVAHMPAGPNTLAVWGPPVPPVF